MVGMVTVFTGSCPKLIESYISLGVTFSKNLMQMVKSTVQNPQPENFKNGSHKWVNHLSILPIYLCVLGHWVADIDV